MGDIRYAARLLLRSPGFAIVTGLALAIGIGANTAIFSVVNGVLLKALPFDDPSRLVAVWSFKESDRTDSTSSFPDFADWRSQAGSFERLAAYATGQVTLTGEREPERLEGAFVTSDLMPLLRESTERGRSFLPEDDKAGANRVALVSHGLWQRRFGSQPELVGRSLTLEGESFIVVGILKPTFVFPIQAKAIDAWVPLASVPFTAALSEQRGAHYLEVIGRLRSGVPIEQAESELKTIAARLAQQHPRSNAGRTVRLTTLHEQLVGDVRLELSVMLGAVGCVLLIACANVANLLLARAAGRRKEITIRAALGASRWRLVRQLLIESVLLSLAGGTLGLLLALWGVDALVASAPVEIPRLGEIALDDRVLAFTLVLSLLTGLVFGLMPALQASRIDLGGALKEASAQGGGTRANRLRRSLVVAEIAVSLVLLIAAGLMIRSFARLRHVNPGFVPDRVITLDISLPDSRYPDAVQQVSFYDRLLGQLRDLPDSQSSAVILPLPLSDSNLQLRFSIEGRPIADPRERPAANYYVASPDYFRTLGIPLLGGRGFNERDTAGAPPVLVINQTFARRYWPNEDPIGKQMTIGYGQPVPRTIVGIVGDVKHAGLAIEPGLQMYAPFPQTPWPFMTVVVRTTADPLRLAGALRARVLQVDRDQPVGEVAMMDEFVSRSMAEPRFNSTLLAAFALVALTLAAIGVYGVIAYSVAQRARELGIRIALGAGRRELLGLIVGQSMRTTLLGLGIGLVGAFTATRLLASLLFGISATDVTTFAGVSGILAAVAFIASYVPARRAMRIDPVVALRAE